MPLDRQFVINRQGKDFVLYAGLLDAAHAAGLVSIETHLHQAPGPENGHVAICTATVRLVTPEGIQKTFTGIGDADTGNVNRMVANALIRMAETRAKARALRDALNVTAELADDQSPDADSQIDVPDKPAPKAPMPTPSPAHSSSATAPAAATAPAPAANTIRSTITARAEQIQADERLALALGYRVRPAPDNESQLRGHLTNLLRAADLNHVLLDLSHQPPHLTAALVGPAILEVERQIMTALKDADLGAIQPAVPPKAKPQP